MRNTIFWLLAFLITASAAVYQRMTGPTYALRGEATLGSVHFKYHLPRSNEGRGDAPVEIKMVDRDVHGVLVYKKYKYNEPWTEIPLQRQREKLTAILPKQPTAGKLEYYLRLYRNQSMITIPGDRDVVIRFRESVPAWVVIPHIGLMFLAMLLSTRAGLEALIATGKTRRLVLSTTVILFIGGMIFGPLMQKYAFGEFWTGVPFGYDLTDNKTLIVLIGWLIPFFLALRGKAARIWILIAALLILVVFSIPHSMLGSELNYQTGTVETGGGH
ncbi:MAG: hypothetical protein NTW14_03020 [bacterium]|nr:hypothetical protein [bacterium]